MKFQIESDVPVIPSPRGRKPTYFPLDQMSVGDSFLIECDTKSKRDVENWRRKLYVAMQRYKDEQLLLSQKASSFRTGVVAGGIRVWRVI